MPTRAKGDVVKDYNGVECALSRCESYEDALETRKDYPRMTSNCRHVSYGSAYLPRKNKNGKVGKRWELVSGAPYTLLEVCEICGVRKTPRKLRWRSWAQGWMLSRYDRTPSRGGDERQWVYLSPVIMCRNCGEKIRSAMEYTMVLDKIEKKIRDIKAEILKTRRGK